MKPAPATIETETRAPVAQNQVGTLVALNPELLIAKAIEANVPVESLERLLAMRADLRNEQAVEAFNHALTTFQADIPVIHKRRTANTGRYSYQYADIADIQRAISPRLKACGLSVTFDTRQEGDTLHVACIVHHVDGHSKRTEFPVPIDRQARMNETQKVGSALTYGRRYALCAALGIVTAEDDDDGQGAGNVSPSAGKPSASSHPTPQAEGDPSGSAPPVRRNGAPDSAGCTAGDGGNAGPISAAQHRRLEARISELGLDSERVRAWVRKATARRPGGPVEHLDELPAALYEKLDGHLEAWAEQARIEAQRAEACRARALEEARHWGWSGAMETLPGVAEKMRDHAAHARDQAKYADRGAGQEIRQAEEIERTAAELERIYAQHEARTEREAIQGEATA